MTYIINNRRRRRWLLKLIPDRRKGSIVCIPEKEYPTQQAAFEEKLEDELELLTAEAKIRGMDKGQFIQFCQHIFEEMEMVPE